MNARNKNTPRYEVLEEISRITDAEVDTDPKIAEMLNRLAAAKESWNSARNAHDIIRLRIEKLPAEISAIENDIAAINKQRPASVAAAILGGGEFAADDALLKLRATLALRAERLRLALPEFESMAHASEKHVQASANPVTSLEGDIEKLRRELKLAEAERRCA